MKNNIIKLCIIYLFHTTNIMFFNLFKIYKTCYNLEERGNIYQLNYSFILIINNYDINDYFTTYIYIKFKV